MSKETESEPLKSTSDRTAIPGDVLKDFLTGSHSGNGEAESGEGDYRKTKPFDKGAAWLLSMVDSEAKDRGHPGLCEMPPEQLAQLTFIAIEEEFGITIDRDSAAGMLVLMLGGMVSANVISIIEKRAEQQSKIEAENNKDDE